MNAEIQLLVKYQREAIPLEKLPKYHIGQHFQYIWHNYHD